MLFGDKLAEILEEREISQKKLALDLNIAPSTLNGYIKNKRQPDFELLKKIAAILDVSIDYLLDHNSGNIISQKEMSLIIKIRSLDKSIQNLIYEIINIAYKNHK